mmetsp:Transcript_12552/g.34277  ORF Transcript_12552/g.34277 Transcript_12552/m.34277 type:complete len:986 (-) Transcript_12552:1519-4476(-)
MGEGGDFRAFVMEQSSRNVWYASILTAIMLLLSAFKAVKSTGLTPVSVLMAAMPMCTHGGAAVTMKYRPELQEGCLLCTMLFRILFGFAMMEGILPIAPWVELVCNLHLDKLVEIIMMGLLEPVRPSFLVPLRILLGVAFGGIYDRVGMPRPRLQGALVHAAGLLVGVLMDWHYRCLYQTFKVRHQSKSKAALAEGHTLDAPAAKKASAFTAERQSYDAVAASTRVAAYTQAGTEQPQTPQALAALLAESFLLPWESSCAQQKCLQQRSLRNAQRQRIYRYKSKFAGKERVAILLQGDISPDDLPNNAGKILAREIEGRLGRQIVAGMAIRPGCVVVCFDVCTVAPEGQRPGRDIQEVCMLSTEAAQEWRQELGLGTSDGQDGQTSVSVLACHSSQTGTESTAATPCSIKARCPVLVMPPKTRSPDEDQDALQRLECPTHMPKEPVMVHLPLVVEVAAPANLGVVRGWHGPADNPEELEDMESSLCLLAAVQGRFLPLDILRVEGTRVELSITLPADVATTITSSTSAELELWAGGKLACSLQVLLVPASRALVAAELELWTQELPAEEAAGFVKDLAQWLHLHQNCCSTTSIDTARATLVRQLVAVGKALLLHSLSCGMVGIAGMLLESLVQPPLNLTFAALASEALAYKPECTSAPSQEPDQAGSDADGPHINAQDLVAAAKHSGSADVVAQFQTWEAQQVNSTFTPSGPPPSHSDALTLWQWVIKVILPFCRLARRARTKMAAAFSAPAQGSTSSCSSTERAAVCAEGAAETGEYRAWVIEQNAMPTKAYFLFAPTHLGILLLRSARGHQLETDAPALALLLSFYLSIALGVHRYPKHTEVLAVFAYLGRLITLLSLGSGMLPVPSSFSAVYRCRTEAILEVFFVSCMEPVRIPWLIPLRIVLVGGYTILYARSGFAHPLLEALAVNGASLLVSMLVDRRHRYIYAWHRANASSRAAAGTAAAAAAPAAGCMRQHEQHVKMG